MLRYLLGDERPYIYRTDDYGRSWTLLTTGNNGIPADEPTRVVREDPVRPGLLYTGTEFGMYVSFDDGAKWHSLQLNLPRTPVTDMKVQRGDIVLSTQGRGFYILDDLEPLRQLRDAVVGAPAHLFTPREAMRLRYSSGGYGVESARENPALRSGVHCIDMVEPADMSSVTARRPPVALSASTEPRLIT